MSDVTIPSSAGEASALIARVEAWRRAGTAVIVATDLDGTIAPIAARPEDASVDPAAAAALRALSSLGVYPCVASGRPLGEIERLLGLDHGCIVLAEDGAVIALPDGRCLREPLSPPQLDALHQVETQARGLVSRHPGAEIERKSSSITVHLRRVPPDDDERARADFEALGELAHGLGLAIVPGRALLEIRPLVANKRDGLNTARKLVAPDSALVYAGDDTTDEPGLALASMLGLAVHITSSERPDPPSLPGVVCMTQKQWVSTLDAMARRLQSGPQST